MLNARVAVTVGLVGVLAFAVGLVVLVLAASATPVGTDLATTGRALLVVGLVATLAGSVLLARVTRR